MKTKNQNIIVLQKKFNKLYLDTFQHSKNIKKWINPANNKPRKQRDLNKSMKNLEKKYKELVLIKKKIINEGISDEDLFKSTSNPQKNSINEYKKLIIQIKDLYKDTKTPFPLELKNEDIYYFSKSKYNNKSSNPYIIAEKNINKYPNNSNTSDYNYDYDYVFYTTPKKRIYKYYFENIKLKLKNSFNNSKKYIKGIASFILASAITLTSGITAGESDISKSKSENNSKSYTTVLNDNTIPSYNTEYELRNSNSTISKEEIKPTVTPESLETIVDPTTQPSSSEKTSIESKQKTTSKSIINQNDFNLSDTIYVAPKGTVYTEAADGSGNFGYFVKDNNVREYCSALVKKDANGNFEILEVSTDNWKDFTQRNNMNSSDFNKYIKDNNIEKYICIQSADKNGPNEEGINQYGWVNENVLKPISKNQMERDLER